ncbi:MAG: class I SAM-dependent methyltransferase [Chloroflexi bacterium]|nr:class I SAM-dependent methyltransferase [Chloroflexota bacterium]MBP8055794.1 class I SAM-dependent methyltransferase [Chloroflexota bacterium]
MSQHLDGYYENPVLWQPTRYVGLDSMRVQKATQWLPVEAHFVLDVGCGNGVLTDQLTGQHQAIGVDRSWSALQWVKSPHAQADVGQLPFKANAFDGLVCMEVLEHLPLSVFTRALSELVRVTRRYLLITVPYCEDREAVRVGCPACGCQFHPNYHMRSFTRPQVEQLLQQWPQMVARRVEAIVPTPRLRYQFLFRWLRQIRRKPLPFPQSAICPQCGYASPPGFTTGTQPPQPSSGYRWWHKFWPKENSFVWWMALYEKRG